MTNLTSHLLQQHNHSQDSRDLAAILNQVVLAGKIISRDINKAGLVDILGSAGKTNIQNEEVQKLDERSNEIIVELLHSLPQVRAVGSEEIDEIVEFNEHLTTGRYIVLFDPLDGSANIDVNVSVGTIFTIFKLAEPGQPLKPSDYLQTGQDVVAAGYILYGSSTMLVYSSGYGVHGFTLDPSIGEFLLSHPHLKMKSCGSIYSTNESYSPHWSPQLQAYIAEVKTDQDISGKPKKALYVGALVADFHRNLLKGGIFMYPATAQHPHGKLRLMFELIPCAYLAHQAGGSASTGAQDILNLQPEELHQRAPFFVGCKDDVARVVHYLNDHHS